MSLPTFQFAGYTLRPTTAEDFPLAAVWTRSDPDHYRKIAPEFWVDGRDSYLLIDPHGPVFFFKIERGRNREAKLYIQFGSDPAAKFRRRTMQGMVVGLGWLKKELMTVGFEHVYFTSKRSNLIAFCTRRLGFTVDGDTLRKNLLEVSDGHKEEHEDGAQQRDGQGAEENRHENEVLRETSPADRQP